MNYLEDISLKKLIALIKTEIKNNKGSSGASVAYGTCSTAAATAAKVVTISENTEWKLEVGSIICVKFSNTNSAQNPTLNVNRTGAKSIWYGTGLVTTNSLNRAGSANTPQIYMYDGTQYVWIGHSTDWMRTIGNYTATIGTTWTGSAAPYSQTITVTGITANDKPIVDVTMSGTYATDQTRLAEWSKIYRIVTAANKITVYANAKTTASLPIQLQVVR